MKKLVATLLIAVVAVSAISFLATAEAKGFMSWRNSGHNQNHGFGYANQQISQNFVRVNAVVNDWSEALETDEIRGTLQAQSRTITFEADDMRQGLTVRVMWTTQADTVREAVEAETDFEYIFYTAKLVEGTAALDSTVDNVNYAYYVEGTWDVSKITTKYDFEFDTEGEVTSQKRETTIEPLATATEGQFKVSTNWAEFTLEIDDSDVGVLSGLITRQRTSSTQCNPFKIVDDNLATINKADLRELTKAYGATPGWGNYDHRMDYNFDYKIDITDLTTAAANVNV
jgi:hypothetical protein